MKMFIDYALITIATIYVLAIIGVAFIWFKFKQSEQTLGEKDSEILRRSLK